MKQFLIALTTVLIFSSCSKNETGDEDSRIKFIERDRSKSSFLYEIIEVDGVEYIASSRGGIYPLVKDTTNKSTQ